MSSLPQRLRAWAALVTFTGTFGFGVLTLRHFGPEDDAACGPVPGSSGHPRMQFEAVKLSAVSTHCPFCHWQRVVSGASLGLLTTGALQLEPLARVLALPARVPDSDVLNGPLSRGPPASV